MRVFKLALRSVASDGVSNLSRSRGPLLVAAQREEAARRIAQLVFGITLARAVGAPDSFEAWVSPDLSSCTDVTAQAPKPDRLRRRSADGQAALADATVPDNAFNGAELLWWPEDVTDRCPV
ncbi:MAG: hypothetical protein OEM91_03530 [Hyphomicrobiales bacterium]|nr:hypothetical protein [Hyphomicrobiales bacterium]